MSVLKWMEGRKNCKKACHFGRSYKCIINSSKACNSNLLGV